MKGSHLSLWARSGSLPYLLPQITQSLPCLWLVKAVWAWTAVCTGVGGILLFRGEMLFNKDNDSSTTRVVKFGSGIFLCFSKVVDAADTYVSHRPLGGLENQDTWVRNHHPVLELPKELHLCPSSRAGLLGCCGTLERCLPLLLFFFFFPAGWGCGLCIL